MSVAEVGITAMLFSSSVALSWSSHTWETCPVLDFSLHSVVFTVRISKWVFLSLLKIRIMLVIRLNRFTLVASGESGDGEMNKIKIWYRNMCGFSKVFAKKIRSSGISICTNFTHHLRECRVWAPARLAENPLWKSTVYVLNGCCTTQIFPNIFH